MAIHLAAGLSIHTDFRIVAPSFVTVALDEGPLPALAGCKILSMPRLSIQRLFNTCQYVFGSSNSFITMIIVRRITSLHPNTIYEYE